MKDIKWTSFSVRNEKSHDKGGEGHSNREKSTHKEVGSGHTQIL